MKRIVHACLCVLVCSSVATFGCDFGGDDGKDTGEQEDAQEQDTAVSEDTAVGTDTNTGTDTAIDPVTAETCKQVVSIADLNANLTSDLAGGATWAWLAAIQETGAYDAGTSTQFYAVCADIFRCESGAWGHLEIAIFVDDQAPAWLNSVRGLTTELSDVGDEAWEYPLQTGVVFWKGGYAVYLGVQSGFTKSWTQGEIDAYAAVVADNL